MEKLSAYIKNPELLNGETLYNLRVIVGRYPYFDAARLLMLRNLFLLHDIDLGKELRKAAVYLKNRRVLFELMEGYGLSSPIVEEEPSVDRTMNLIDAFLSTLPTEKLSLEAEGAAAVDYASAYLATKTDDDDVPKMRGQELIDDFLSGGNEKIFLQPAVEQADEKSEPDTELCEIPQSEGLFFTETLANIYIKQGKYDKALEIIRRLCLEYPNKNRYFADQIRFLEKILKYAKRQ